MKLAVGVRDISHIAALQQLRAANDPPLRHLTRQFPKQAPALLDGGSLYWVISGLLLVRQRLRAITPDQRADGTPCTALVLDPKLVPVAPRPVRPFQGWRYLAEPPEDLDRTPERDAMPAEMAAQLRRLGLI